MLLKYLAMVVVLAGAIQVGNGCGGKTIHKEERAIMQKDKPLVVENLPQEEVVGSWKEMAKSPLEGRFLYTSVLSGTKLVIWGGRGQGKICNDGAIYDIEKDQWQEMPKAPVKIGKDHTIALLGTKMLVSAIWAKKKKEADAAIYDIEKNEWKKMAKDAKSPHRGKSRVETL